MTPTSLADGMGVVVSRPAPEDIGDWQSLTFYDQCLALLTPL